MDKLIIDIYIHLFIIIMDKLLISKLIYYYKS